MDRERFNVEAETFVSEEPLHDDGVLAGGLETKWLKKSVA